MSALSRFDDLPRWLLWRADPRRDDPTKLTKVPYQPNGRKASSTASATWVTRATAEAAMPAVVNGQGGGIGIVLGKIADETMLAGIDLDSCLGPDGTLADWAGPFLAAVPSYTEISPSGGGLKTFFYMAAEDVRPFLEHTGVDPQQWGFSRSIPGERPKADHGPGIELYTARRYFAVTGNPWPDQPDELAALDWPALQRLVQIIPPADQKHRYARTGRDNSRSAIAFRKGAALNATGKSFEEMCEALRHDPETADWYAEKGTASGERELHRIWDKAEDQDEAADDGELPTIRLRGGNRPEAVEAAISALDAAGVPLYRRGLDIAHVARIPAKASDGRPITTPAIMTVPAQRLLHELGKAAIWQKFDGRSKEWVHVDVPPDIAARIAALPNEWRFPPLAGIIGTQTLRPDGSLLAESGYDPATSYLLFDPPRMAPTPSEPTRERSLAALNLLDRLLDEFPFVFDAAKYKQADNPSRSVALSALMTPVLRPALPPAVPLHVFKAPAGGTGKSYLADLASALATG
jgi:hypothetical protein